MPGSNLTPPKDYRAFLLRCWLEPNQEGHPDIWRFNLEEVGDGQRNVIPTLEGLIQFLEVEFKSEE
jgi:hypothetical protein